jgi:hypothetical protein
VRDEAPSLLVRVLRDGIVVHEETCETSEQADRVLDEWSDTPGVRVEVVDLEATAVHPDADDREIPLDDER